MLEDAQALCKIGAGAFPHTIRTKGISTLHAPEFYDSMADLNLCSILRKATELVLQDPSYSKLEPVLRGISSLSDLVRFIFDKQLVKLVFAEAALLANSAAQSTTQREKRNSIKFLVNNNRPRSELVYTEQSSVSWAFVPDTIRQCVISANKSIERLHDLSSLYSLELFDLLELRNLSSLVGEIFAREVCMTHSKNFMKNPNQDGYPDLCTLTPEGIKFIRSITDSGRHIRRDKQLWSPYNYGGVEIKATCGNTPPARKAPKPGIGDSRIQAGLVSAEWKAHHQLTKNLLGIFWDFVDRLPTVSAAFYRNDLDTTIGKTNTDWMAITMPTEGGGRTTSVSVMKRHGVKKMGQGWLVLPANEELLQPIVHVFGVP